MGTTKFGRDVSAMNIFSDSEYTSSCFGFAVPDQKVECGLLMLFNYAFEFCSIYIAVSMESIAAIETNNEVEERLDGGL